MLKAGICLETYVGFGNEVCGLATLASLSWGLLFTPSGPDDVCRCVIILGTISRAFLAQTSSMCTCAHVHVHGTKPARSCRHIFTGRLTSPYPTLRCG